MKRFYISKVAILIAILLGWNMNVSAQSTTFIYTGAVQSYTVGTATLLGITAVGGCGGTEYLSGCAMGTVALGGMVTCHLAVTPGEVLYIYVGGLGQNDNLTSCSTTKTGGWNGGVNSTSGYGSASGGATDIRLTNTPAITNSSGFVPGSTLGSSGYRIIVAGAGGAGADWGGVGGCGGGLTGGTPVVGPDGGTVGTGGTQTAGGGGGPTGGFGWGGTPGDGYAGGGGGYWGGGGGNGVSAGGGGGSSYTDPTLCSSVVHTQCSSVANGNGMVGIQVLCTGAVAGTIVGPSAVCTGQSATYSDPTGSAGGYWTSSNTSVATVNSTTGAVTGVAVGSANIIYNLTVAAGFCSTLTPSVTITVNQSPLPISGPSNICTGSPATLSTLSTGGVWSSSSTSLATVVTSTGVVTGLAYGFPTISYTFPVSGCAAMYPTTVNVSPAVHNVTGGGTFCAGGTGVSIGLNGTDYLVNYQLYLGATPELSAMSGTGSAINLGVPTALGTYTVTGTSASSGCVTEMNGSATEANYAVIPAHNVTGGGTFCAGTSGVSIGLDGSNAGISYQLYNGLAGDGAAVTGTGSPITFGARTATGTRTVVATSLVSGCSATMTGSVPVNENPVPAVNNLLTPGGTTFCAGGSGISIGLNGSTTGVTYSLVMDGTTTIATMAGTGSPFTFSTMASTSGTYTIDGSYSTGCSTVMAGSAAVASIPLPPIDAVSGGGGYCIGGVGVPIGMAYSVMGINYQLFNSSGTAVSSVFSGVDGSLNFGIYTTGGAYHVVAVNAASSCSSTMSGSAMVTVNSLPATEPVSGGGSFCPGSSTSVLLGGSVIGTNYQLYNGATAVGSPMTGTGSSFAFSSVSDSGDYTVVATNGTTGCSNNMTGSAMVNVYSSPTVYNVSGGGGYCAGGSGLPIGLSGSDLGTTYKLYKDGSYLTSFTGTGSPFNYSSMTGSGTYTIVAQNPTACIANMSGSGNITINPLPEAFSVMGGGPYCIGGTGSDVSLSFSTVGVTYQLFMGGTFAGTAIGGTGAALDLGTQSAAGTYSVVATNVSTGCTSGMTGSTNISVLPLPVLYTVSGTNSFCAGGAGVPVMLSNSTSGTEYQLYNGTLPVGSAMSGSGTMLNFGLQTSPGTYTVAAFSTATTCSNSMTGSATISVNPAPNIHTVTGGGNYCTGGMGVNIGIDTSDLGISYTLYKGSTMIGSWMGNGSTLNFGDETGVGTYTVISKDTASGCTGSMSGDAMVTTLPLPVPYTVIGGGSYCAGASGTHISLSSSTSGIIYYLTNGTVTDTMAGTGSSLDFGAQTNSGSYTATAMNATTGCMNNMNASAVITVNPLPNVFTVTGGGPYCAGGGGVPVSLGGSNSGISYILYNGSSAEGTFTGSGSVINFGYEAAPGTYTVIAVNTLTGCTSNMNASALVTVNPLVVPSVSVSSSIPSTVCAGTMGTYTATVTGGGSGTTYQWYVSGGSAGTSNTYGFTPVDGQNVYVVITSDAPCASPTTATSTPITMTVIANQTPSVSINSTSDNVCQGSNVFFTAMPSYGGTGATYAWVKDGSVIGTGASLTYNVIPANNDQVSVVMTSNYPCLMGTSDSATSNMITIAVAPALDPVVIVTASPSNIIKMNATVTFTANVTGAGTSPMYQWSVNGVQVAGATGQTYANNNFNDGDVVTCAVSGTNICGTMSGNSNQVTMSVENTTGVSSITTGGNDLKLVPNPNKGDFTVSGTLGATDQQTVSIEITNMLGQVVYKDNASVQNGKINEHIQLSNSLSSGVYMLNLSSGSGNTVFHFVIQ